MLNIRKAALCALASLSICGWNLASAQNAVNVVRTAASPGDLAVESPVVPSRVVQPIDDTRLVRLTGNTHPMARAEYDKGPVDPQMPLERIQLVLQRSPAQEAALEKLIAEQYEPGSANFHHWLTPEEFGKLYGPSDADIAMVTSWLQNHGFQIYLVTNGRVHIEFSGTAAQVSQAFHTEIHRYVVDGVEHIANDRDPSIPAALAPVIEGIASLHNFFPKHQSQFGRRIKMDRKTHKFSLADPGPPSKGLSPDLSYQSGGYDFADVTPYDFATIYNVLPLWNAGIDGTGMTVAISGASDIVLTDVETFRSSFGLPATKLTTIVNGTDPGLVTTGAQGENTLDVEMSGGVAKNAMIDLVVSASTATSFGGTLSDSYIIDHKVAPVMSASYGTCELGLGTSGNASINAVWQQATAQGISAFESSGDQGAAGCLSQDTAAPNATPVGLQVNGDASSPYVTAVGGTDLIWFSSNYTTYWNTTNAANGSSAKSYIPEMPWNATCTSQYLYDYFWVPNYSATSLEQVCNNISSIAPDLVKITAGSGGESACTTNSTTSSSTYLDPTSCSGGYAKPSWQSGVAGIPADGHRDIPDISLFAAGGYPDGFIGSAWLFCQSSTGTNGCDYSNPTYIVYQETGGTSASSPAMAGVMALIVEKVGSWQGLANPELYKLAAKETLSNCNGSSSTTLPASSCVFNDVTYGNNSQVCQTGSQQCVTNTSGDTYGILSGYYSGVGYDQATGLGSLNVANLADAWSSTVSAPTVTLTPTSLTFASTTVGASSTAQVVTLKNTSASAVVDITSGGITITGTDYTSYGGTTTCGTTLAAGATCTISITFKPAAAGTLTATLSVADNATGTPQKVTLTGTGAAVVPTVTLTPTSLTFASTDEGATSAVQVVTLKNTSASAALTIGASGITFTGTDATSYLKTTTCGTSLAAAASCTISVSFKPLATGSLTATLSVADNATGSLQKVTLTGTGVAAPTKAITLTPTTIAFPNTVAAATSEAVPVTVKNTGTAAVTISSIALAGTNPTDFEELNTCPASLASGVSCTVFVAFKPASAAAFKATLNVTDNATGSPQEVVLSGTGTAAISVTLSATALAFPTTTHGTQSATKSITVTNAGTSTLDITGIALTGFDVSSFFELNDCGPTLAPATSCVIDVAFKPATTGSLAATLTVSDNGSSSPQKVSLTGTGD